MAKVRKAVITAAGIGTRHFPATRTVQKEMMPLVDRDGTTKPTIQLIVEEALESGIERICIVASPANEAQFREHFRPFTEPELETFRGRSWALQEGEKLARLSQHVEYVVQQRPEGYGHAVYCAREFVGDDPFLLLLGDHVYISGTKKPCCRQILDVYEEHECPVSGVQRTAEDLLHLYGTVTGRRISSDPDVYEVSHIKEKPTLDYAEEHLRTAGLPRSEYLCFFGMHVFPPAIFEALERCIREDIRERGEIQMTTSQALLQEHTRYLAAEINGERYDMGVPFGYIQTQIALALNSPARRRVLAALPHLLTVSDLEALR